MKYLTVLCLLSFFSLASEEEKQCYSITHSINDYKQLFSGQISVYGYTDGTGIKKRSWKLKELNNANLLNKYNLKKGDVISHICGVSLNDMAGPNDGEILCCNEKYPETLTISVTRTLIEQFEIEIPRQEYVKAYNKALKQDK